MRDVISMSSSRPVRSSYRRTGRGYAPSLIAQGARQGRRWWPMERLVRIEAFGIGGAGVVALPGELAAPEGARGVVVFAHGSGSGRLSPRNLMVAQTLRDRGLATLLFDLLTDGEARDRRNVFDIPLLGDRLLTATTWLRARPDMRGLALGYFGASTGAAAALWAAAEPDNEVEAIVSRGGRQDLAWARLGEVTAPTLLI